MRFLVFVIAAPMMSFGEIAVDERRGTATRPTRSAICGLVAAALGIDRDAPELQAVAQGYDVAVRVDRPGQVMADYHTIQAPHESAVNAFVKAHGRQPATRREELGAGRVETKVTRRDYLVDAAFTVAMSARESAPRTLEEISKHLVRPHWRLSAGRRSCPLALPPSPRLVEANTLASAFRTYDAEEDGDLSASKAPWRRMHGLGSTRATVASDVGLEGVLGFIENRREIRRDAPSGSSSRLFSRRTEIVGTMTETAE